MTAPTIVFAKETGSILASDQHHTTARVAYYEIPIIPAAPLRVGQTVRIKVITPCDTHRLLSTKLALTQYTANETGIQGRITKITSMTSSTTEFLVRNDLPSPAIAHAFIAIPHIQGITVRLGPWARLTRMLRVKPHHATIQSRLETSAVIYEDIPVLRMRLTPPASFLNHDNDDE
ncbi:hypothetical protein C8Q79DRAFT_1014196 [Trametes meyenii]|nr:hypothetical protein C8Q79DRAFT_1014196 [Trametes meyenii]